MIDDHTQPPAVSAEEFKAAMAALAAPVTVVTFRDGNNEARGLTASAVTSLSLDPPLILVCLDRRATIHDALVTADSFCVNVLGPGSETLSLRFASQPDRRFAGVRLLAGHAPALADADVRLRCNRYRLYDGGDHTILIGLVIGIDGDAPGGLIWHQRSFAHTR